MNDNQNNNNLNSNTVTGNNINLNQNNSNISSNNINNNVIQQSQVQVQSQPVQQQINSQVQTAHNLNNVQFQTNLNNNSQINNIPNAINQTQLEISKSNNIQLNNNLNNKSKSKKIIKIILIILAALLIVGIGIFVYSKFNDSNKNSDINLNLIFDPNKPIIVKNKGKYGYITSEGKTMIEPQYNSAGDFYGDYAVVSIDNPDIKSYSENLYQIIDKKGNVKLTSEEYSEPEYYATYDVWVVDGVLYDSNLNRMLSEGITVKYIDYEYFEYSDSVKNESGIMTYKGKKIFTMPGTSIFADISENEYNKEDLYASVKTYSDPEKEVVISLKTGDILFTSEDVENYYISEKENGIFYYYDRTSDDGYKNGKYLFFINNKLAYQTTEEVNDVEVYDYQNQILEIDFGYDYETLGKTQKIYYYDVKNKKMLEEKPASSTSTTDLELDLIEQTYGFKEYSSSGKYGLMSGEKVIVPCEYDYIEYLHKNVFNYMKSRGKELVLLEKDKTLVLYDLKNSENIKTFNSNYIYDYDDSTFIKVILYSKDDYKTTGYIIYNLLSDKSMTFENDDDIVIGSNYVTVEKDNKKTYYNTDFKQIYVGTEY